MTWKERKQSIKDWLALIGIVLFVIAIFVFAIGCAVVEFMAKWRIAFGHLNK